ncbi:archaeal heat shock protein Hsp20 [Thermoproteus tenax]|uniref:Small heat shock protein n=1 Tax=Thermoproteus tenax (strain ATCC 35583 / DSM 2078 / JCM 9277 / NBRC 100435 / Kra 1) TaxID=768679 RepID=G4RQ41_THETK|nr:archaeal heat shock protein Hsp20 [Thermoproteus tenax]CCC81687.1 small heat shock protein [Thermoproteus tenax Kra 1]
MSIFDEIDRIMRRWQRFFEDLEKEIDEEFRRLASQQYQSPRRPRFYYYGFEITMGPDGKPVVREFGNVRGRKQGGIEVVDEIEPLTDVVEDDGKIRVVAEMPGVEKEDIKVRLSNDNRTLIISASGKDRKYYKEIPLPAEVIPDKTKASYRNGVLTVELEKKDKGRGGFEIKVE